MATPHPSDLPILEKAISALNNVSANRRVSGDGLGDADITGLANPGTVELLATAIDAFVWHASDMHVAKGAAAALRIAGEPMFAIAAPTIGNVTTADGGGTLADVTEFFYCVCAIDRNGNLSAPSAEDSVTTGNVDDDSTNTIPWTESTGAMSYRVF
jgi:hypothetical protein